MKRIILYLSLCFSAVLATHSQTLTDSLVACYPFNGNAGDSSGNNNHGTVEGAQLTVDILGKSNSAYHFDGTDDYILLDTAIILPGELTISAWVKFDSLPQKTACIFSTRDQCPSNSRGWSTSNLCYDPGNGLVYGVKETVNCSGGYSSDFYRAEGFSLKIDVYYFVTVTITNNNKEGRVVSFFINGKKYAAKQYINNSTDDAFNGSNYKTFIGAYTNEGPVDLNSFTGVLDDIRIYNRVLSSQEVNALYAHISFHDTLFIVEQPEDAGGYPGSKHELNTLGFGKNLNYQWFRNDIEIQDADSNIFIVDNMSEADTGSYFCKIFNSSDTVFTDTVILSCDFKSALVAYYPFNGNANDSSVNNNHGSVNGAQLAKDALGRENSAYHFDGQDDYIELSEAIVLENELTISAWVKFDSLPGRQATIFSTRQQCPSSSRGWTPSCLHYKPGNGLMYTVYETGNCNSGSSSDDYRADGFFPGENKYYFFTVTVKNNNKESRAVRFFVNGKEYPMVQVRDHGSVQAFNATDYKSLIGLYTYDYSDGTYPFTGVIDELSIYKRALEPELIDSIYRDIYDADTIILINQPVDKRIQVGSKLHLHTLAMGKSINYQWYKDGQMLMGNTSCSLIVDEMVIEDTGSYFCKIFNDTDTVFTDTAQISYYLETGFLAYDGLETTTVKVYPNPTNDIVYISLQDENIIKDYTVKIVDVSGKVIHKSALDTDLTEIGLDRFGEKGLYFIQILDDSMQIIDTRKIILK